MKDYIWVVEVRVNGGAWFPLVAAAADTRAEARDSAAGLSVPGAGIRGPVQRRVRKYQRVGK
jgi:hypothetical protein